MTDYKTIYFTLLLGRHFPFLIIQTKDLKALRQQVKLQKQLPTAQVDSVEGVAAYRGVLPP